MTAVWYLLGAILIICLLLVAMLGLTYLRWQREQAELPPEEPWIDSDFWKNQPP
jgi:hypothetical protein